MKFDLMKKKPQLDIDTLNYIWDYLWRKNRCNDGKNVVERSKAVEQNEIMKMLQYFADSEENKE